jgi:hypothetical protein
MRKSHGPIFESLVSNDRLQKQTGRRLKTTSQHQLSTESLIKRKETANSEN